MSLYLVYSDDINKRECENIFILSSSSCHLFNNDNPLFIYENVSLEAYKNIVNYASKNNIENYEILLNLDNDIFKELINYLSSYLFDKDLSIGLITNDKKFINKNKNIIDKYGINIPLPFKKPVEEKVDIFKVECRLIDPGRGVHFRKMMVKGPRKRINRKILLEESFHDKFLRLLRESNKDNVEVYTKGGITRQVFSNILSNKDMIPTKATIICLIIGMELPFIDAKSLLLSAGYALSSSILFDSIIMKYLRDDIFDLDLINSELNEFGCPLLGWHPRG